MKAVEAWSCNGGTARYIEEVCLSAGLSEQIHTDVTSRIMMMSAPRWELTWYSSPRCDKELRWVSYDKRYHNPSSWILRAELLLVDFVFLDCPEVHLDGPHRKEDDH